MGNIILGDESRLGVLGDRARRFHGTGQAICPVSQNLLGSSPAAPVEPATSGDGISRMEGELEN